MPRYFRQVPDFEYVSRLPDAKIGDYFPVKNLFKKGKLREDIFQDLAFFTKYKVEGDDRPDNVAFKVYGDSTLDWLVLICNNVVNIQTEWPLTQQEFDRYLLQKYSTSSAAESYFKSLGANVNANEIPTIDEEFTYSILYNGIHHYETPEIKNSQGVTIVPAGLQVQSDYSISFYDYFIDSIETYNNIAIPVTNYEYEEKIENDKRNIFVLKPRYLNVVIDDMQDIMEYKKGSSQYQTETLKRGDNIKLYE